jgi:uncharacterized damage-inducible protein DinB
MRRFHTYNRWADDRVLDALAGLSLEELTQTAPVATGSLRGALLHTLLAQLGWLAACSGAEAWGDIAGRDGSSVQGLREMFGISHDKWDRFLESLSEEKILAPLPLPLDEPFERSAGQALVSWARANGGRPQRPLWQSILHVVNHSTQHRAEIGICLAEKARSPGDLDYGTFEEYRAIGVMPAKLESG